MQIEIGLWIGFLLFILMMMCLDLGVWRRTPHVIEAKEALVWSAFWILISFCWMFIVYFIYENKWMPNSILDGETAAIQYITGYVVEKTLSLDNILIIALVFTHFHVPLPFQHRVLTWGILGVLVLRFVMILIGAALLQEYAWVSYIFGAILFYTAIKMLTIQHESIDTKHNILVLFARRYFPVTEEFHGEKFFVRVKGDWYATPLLIALLVIESSDVLFAIDSIPAIFAITDDPFLVFTSNIFAIMGLRSLYFILSGWVQRFTYLKTSLVFLLAFIGVKMVLIHHYQIPALVTLIVIFSILTVGIIASLLSLKGR